MDREIEPRKRVRELWEQPVLLPDHTLFAPMIPVREPSSEAHRQAPIASQTSESRKQSIKSEPSSKHSGISNRHAQPTPNVEQVRKPLVINYHPRPTPKLGSAHEGSVSVNSRATFPSVGHSSHSMPKIERPIPLPSIPR